MRGGVGWWSFIRRSKSPELPVVLLEDLGALTGLFFALTGVLLAHFTENPRWDAAGSVAIGLLLLVISIVARDRDEGPADRRVRGPGEAGRHHERHHANRRTWSG